MIRKQLLSLVFGRAAQIVFSLLTLKILTNRFSQVDVANYYFTIAFATWFVLTLISPIGMWVTRHFHEWKGQYSFGAIGRLYLGYHFVVGVVAVIVALGVNGAFNLNETIETSHFILGIIAALAFQSFYQFLAGYQNLAGRKESYGLQVAVGQAIIFSSTLPILFMERPTLLEWFGIWSIGHVLASVIFLLALSNEFDGPKRVAKISDLIHLRALLEFCLPALTVALVLWLNSQGYRIVLSQSGDLSLLATAAVSLGLASTIGGSIETLIHQFLLPDFYKNLADQPDTVYSTWYKLFSKVVLFSGIAFLGLSAFAPSVLALLTNREYLEGARFLRWGALFEFIRITTGFVYIYFVGEKRLTNVLPCYSAGAFVSLLFFSAAMLFSSMTEALVLMGIVSGPVVTFIGLQLVLARERGWKFPFRELGLALLFGLPFYLVTVIPGSDSGYWSIVSLLIAGIYTVLVLRFLSRLELL